MLSLALLGCATPSKDPGSPAAEGWTIGHEVACDDPAALGWVDRSADWAADTPTWPDPDTSETRTGCLAVLTDAAGEASVLESEPGGITLWRRGQAPVRRAGEQWRGRLVTEDLERDGDPELVALAPGNIPVTGLSGVVWNATTTADAPTPFAPEDDGDPGAAAFLDADGDGRPDVLVAHPQGRNENPPPTLYTQEDDHTWARVPDPLGADETFGVTWDLAAWDADADGDVDVYRCNDGGASFGGNALVLADGGGQLHEADVTGLEVATSCMGASVGDLDADGALDVVLTAAAEVRALLAIGPTVWADATEALDLPTLQPEQMAWGSAIVDVDDDGLPDLLVATADDQDELEFGVILLRGLPEGGFEATGEALGLPQATGARGLAAVDLNGDHALDVVVGDWRRPPWVLESRGCSAGAWLEIDAPLGSTVVVEAGGRAWAATASAHQGYCGSANAPIHLGLGDVEHIDRITLSAPGAAPSHLDGPLTPRRHLRWDPT